ncbi:hypothetical protein E2C01_086004 [Portunus trituberculatus]|uniref:Uncharacterized protein n=1 Tax=Portunus trituberculatus TaxID=210409 RepID=A0A5B7JAD8_PORTR|nr:hypothetical protein [Portunus trituberculatus]
MRRCMGPTEAAGQRVTTPLCHPTEGDNEWIRPSPDLALKLYSSSVVRKSESKRKVRKIKEAATSGHRRPGNVIPAVTSHYSHVMDGCTTNQINCNEGDTQHYRRRNEE